MEILTHVRSTLENWQVLVDSLRREPTPTERILRYNCGLLLDEINRELQKEEVSDGIRRSAV